MLWLPDNSSTLEQHSSTCKEICNYVHSLYNQSSNRQETFFSRLYTFDAIDIQPPNKVFIFFHKFWKSFEVISSCFKKRVCFVLCSSLCSRLLNKKLFHQCLPFFTLRIARTLKGAKSINSFASFLVKALSKATFFQCCNSFW